MAVDVTEIQKRISAIVDQDENSVTAGDDDWTLRLKYINMAQTEWAESYQWPTLFKEVYTKASTSTANVTLSLPSDFRKFDGYLTICDEDNSANEYAQVQPQEKSQYVESDKYFYILGDPNGYYAVINPGTHASGASIAYSYWASPASLVSPANVSMCPDPNFLVQKTVGYLWRARDDGRFTFAEAEAEKILSRMLEFEVTKGHSYDDRVKTYEETRYGFRIGRD